MPADIFKLSNVTLAPSASIDAGAVDVSILLSSAFAETLNKTFKSVSVNPEAVNQSPTLKLTKSLLVLINPVAVVISFYTMNNIFK